MQAIPRDTLPRQFRGFIPLLFLMGIIWGALILGAILPQLQAIFTPPLSIAVEEITMFGNGWLEDVAFSPDGSTLAVASSVGVWLYPADLSAEGRLLQGHSAPVQAVAYHPSGALLASAGWDDTVRLWDTVTYELLLTLRGHSSDVVAIAFNQDGTRLLSGAFDREARLWDVATGENLLILSGHTDHIEAVAIAPNDSALVTTGRDGTLRAWTMDGTPLYTMQASNERLLTLTFAPDGTLYTGGREGILSAWRDGERLIDYAVGGTISELHWADDALWIGWSDDTDDHHLSRLDIAIGTLEAFTHLDSAPVGIAHDGERIALASDAGDLALYTANGQRLAEVGAGHSGAVNALIFSPNGDYLASGGGNIFTDDKALRLWHIESRALVRVMNAHDDWVRSLAYSPDGALIAVGTMAGQVMVYEADTGAILHDFHQHEGIVLSLGFAPDGQKLASGGADERIHIYDLTTGDTLASIENAGGPVRTLLIDFNTDFSDSASISDQLSAFSVPDTGGVTLLCSHGDDIEGSSFNAARTLRATSTYQNDIRITDFTHGTFIRALEGHTNWVNDTNFSPDGRMLASGSYDLTARLWDVINGQALAELSGHTRPVTRTIFSPDGSTLATASEDGSIRLWNIRHE